MFAVTAVPENKEDVIPWLYGELTRLAGVFALIEQGQFLDLHTAAPVKPRERQIVFADGTSWDPGSGKGVYCYYNSSWHFLG
jgi:hypothetical protein